MKRLGQFDTTRTRGRNSPRTSRFTRFPRFAVRGRLRRRPQPARRTTDQFRNPHSAAITAIKTGARVCCCRPAYARPTFVVRNAGGAILPRVFRQRVSVVGISKAVSCRVRDGAENQPLDARGTSVNERRPRSRP
jgi:hypothetical protein